MQTLKANILENSIPYLQITVMEFKGYIPQTALDDNQNAFEAFKIYKESQSIYERTKIALGQKVAYQASNLSANSETVITNGRKPGTSDTLKV